MNAMNNITCPSCKNQFDVEDVILKKVLAEQEQALEKQQQQLQATHEKKLAELKAKEATFEEKRKQQNELFQAKLTKELEAQKDTLRKDVHAEFELKVKSLTEDAQAKSDKLRKYQEMEVEFMKKEAKLKEEKEDLKLKLEKDLLEKQQIIEEKARQKERESFELEKVQLLKQIEDNKRLAEEMKRKAEQGSMQMQGEVQELAIEEALRRHYPFDLIQEVAKGVRGADTVQTVVNSMQKTCGKIIYESKRTQNFGPDWIPKLKKDQIAEGADIALIVTETMPKGMDSFGQKDGVWVCTFKEFVPLVNVLRQILIKVRGAKIAEENKGDKMEVMYKFVTSPEFSQRLKAISDGFTNMKIELEREKTAMNKIWNRREKQINMILDNTTSLEGSIEGIAGQISSGHEILDLDEEEHLFIE